MITVHMIFNAHLDPIWLWPWQAGLDEALATCRSACDRLDAHPDLFFTQGEAAIFHQIEQADPVLFERIRRHVASGQWEISGGWWLQPDCNFPTGFAMQKQIELGKQYCLDRFGMHSSIGFSVDSFGHASALPGLMRAAGQDGYVMMRPMPHEMALPARIFRWRGEEGGPEVITFRIADKYTTRVIDLEHIRMSLADLPNGVEDTMCFVGLGDHGGGATERMISWLREHQHAIDGARLVFSTTRRFFDAVAGQVDRLPVVTGELQYHSVGCYSVVRDTKTASRRAEHRLAQAELLSAAHPEVVNASAAGQIRAGWEKVCFHHFHDTIGGSCIPSAYRKVDDDFGGAAAAAEEILHFGLRRKLRALPDDPMQRLVLLNVSDQPFAGPIYCEPWMEYRDWQPHWHLIEEGDRVVPCQHLAGEHLAHWRSAIIFRAALEPMQMRTLRIRTNSQIETPKSHSPLGVSCDAVRSGSAGVQLSREPGLSLGGMLLPLPRLELIADRSDTWAHATDRFGEMPEGSAQWEVPALVDAGAVMAALMQRGSIGRSDLTAEWRVYAEEPFVELRLRVLWAEQMKILKLVLPTPAPILHRDDGVMGGSLRREVAGNPHAGREEPIHDLTCLRLADGSRFGVVCPDVFALDAKTHRLRLTLLRSPLMAHMDLGPNTGTDPRGVVADQGVHEFRFRFFAGDDISISHLQQQALMLHRPPLYADLTRGMPPA